MLEIADLNVSYGQFQALHDVSLRVAGDEVAALVGRNGTGKTTIMKAVMGMVGVAAGSIRFGGEGLVGREPHEVARAGVAFVPDDRRVMPGLSVDENLRLGYLGHRDLGPVDERREVVFDYFPRLAEKHGRRAAALSGGEQQMLAIGRALMADPDLVLLDEPIEGLMPAFVDDIADVVYRLSEEGVSLLVVEHDLGFAFDVSDHTYIVYEGNIVADGPSETVRNDDEIKRTYLSV